MRSIILRSAGVLACLALPVTAAMAQQDMLGRLLDKAGEVYAGRGYANMGWNYGGSLRQGQEERVTVALQGGAEYQLVGACDTSCSDFDIQLLDSSGNEVDKDDKEDDFPIVGINRSGKFTARVVMTKCAAAAGCSYALRVFRK